MAGVLFIIHFRRFFHINHPFSKVLPLEDTPIDGLQLKEHFRLGTCWACWTMGAQSCGSLVPFIHGTRTFRVDSPWLSSKKRRWPHSLEFRPSHVVSKKPLGNGLMVYPKNTTDRIYFWWWLGIGFFSSTVRWTPTMEATQWTGERPWDSSR